MFKKCLCLGLALISSVLSLSSCSKPTDTLIVGLECVAVPFNWVEDKPNDYTLKVDNKFNQFADGYDIQIAKKIRDGLNVDVKIFKTPWEALISDLQMGTIDLVISSMTPTAERKKSIDFTDSYYTSSISLCVKKEIADEYNHVLSDNEMNELINGKPLVAHVSTIYDKAIGILVDKYGAVHNKPADSYPNLIEDVKSGMAFGFVEDSQIIRSLIIQNKELGIINFDKVIINELSSELENAIGIKKGRDELREKINDILKTISEEERQEMMNAAVNRAANI